MAKTGPKPTSGWVYVLSNPAWPGFSKIGAALSLKDRCRAYQVSSPFRDFVVEAALQFPDRFAAEAELHSLISGHRQGSTEWFKIHPQDAALLLRRLHREVQDG